jgi:hypothetical protein
MEDGRHTEREEVVLRDIHPGDREIGEAIVGGGGDVLEKLTNLIASAISQEIALASTSRNEPLINNKVLQAN